MNITALGRGGLWALERLDCATSPSATSHEKRAERLPEAARVGNSAREAAKVYEQIHSFGQGPARLKNFKAK